MTLANLTQGTYPRRGNAVLSGTCIVHTSEGPWMNGVDALTRFLEGRMPPDYGSYHRACDWADIEVYFDWEWEAWQDAETNNWAVGIAAACKTTDWAIMPINIREGYYRNMARMAADFVVYMKSAKNIDVPLRRITGHEARNRVPGFCAHGDSGVSRSDPGVDFNWNLFFQYTAELLTKSPIVEVKPIIEGKPKMASVREIVHQQIPLNPNDGAFKKGIRRSLEWLIYMAWWTSNENSKKLDKIIKHLNIK